MRYRSLCFAAIATAVVCWANPEPPQTPTQSQKSAAKAILALDEKWSAAAHGHDLAATLSYYSDDAVVLAPNAPIAKTKKEIKDVWASMTTANVSISWKCTKVEVSKSLDMAYSYGTYDLSIKDGDKTITDKGKFVEIWKKQKDGKWKCSVDAFNSDLPVG